MRHVVLSHNRPAVTKAEAALTKKLTRALRAAGKTIAAYVASHTKGLGKAAEEDEDVADAAVARTDWSPVAEPVRQQLTLVARDGAQQVLAKLTIADDDSITEQTFTSAVDFAKARAAELVGKSWDGDELVDNPDADMAITDTMREEIRDAVAEATESGDSAADLADRIEGLGSFSESRAMMISRTEIIRGHAQGNLIAMRASGVVEKKGWSTSNDDDVDEECEANEDEGAIDLDDDFQSGDDAPPAHPACRCVLTAEFPESAESEEDDADDDTEEDEDDAAE